MTYLTVDGSDVVLGYMIGSERKVMSGYMPRGPNVAIILCIVSNAKQDLYVGMLALFEAPCPSFRPTGKCMPGTQGHCPSL